MAEVLVPAVDGRGRDGGRGRGDFGPATERGCFSLSESTASDGDSDGLAVDNERTRLGPPCQRKEDASPSVAKVRHANRRIGTGQRGERIPDLERGRTRNRAGGARSARGIRLNTVGVGLNTD